MITPQELAAQYPQFAQQQPAQAFTWGAGGQRLTPEQLASQQAVAAELMKSNYSPVQNVWQGLGRVTDNILGAIDSRKLDKEQASNNAYSDSIAQALLGGGGSDAAARAMINPYLSKDVQGLAKLQYQAANRPAPEPSQFERALSATGVLPGTPEYAQAMDTYVKNQLDPFTNIVSGGEQYSGRQSLVQNALMGGGDPVSTGGNVPMGNPLDPTMGAVRVSTPDDLARLKTGDRFIAPDGSIRVKH